MSSVVKNIKVENLFLNRSFKITWDAKFGTLKYYIYRSEAYYDGFRKVAETISGGIREYTDVVSKNFGLQWWYKVTALSNTPTPVESSLEKTIPVASYPQDGFLNEPVPSEDIDEDLPGDFPET